MKEYKKTYEDVFSTDHPNNNTKLYMDKVSVEGMELDEYITLFKDFLNDFFDSLFDDSVKLSWLRRSFKYYDRKTILPMNKNSQILNSAFVKVLRRKVGKDIQIITRGKFFSKLELYFDELFPKFEEENPFTNPEYYKFPFKNITVDYLMAVYQLDDRIKLLKIADKKDMSYAVFLDYIINHVCSINEELGRNKYEIRQNQDRNFPFFIKDVDKELKDKRIKRKNG